VCRLRGPEGASKIIVLSEDEVSQASSFSSLEREAWGSGQMVLTSLVLFSLLGSIFLAWNTFSCSLALLQQTGYEILLVLIRWGVSNLEAQLFLRESCSITVTYRWAKVTWN
jgi:hypothetical protein